MKDAFRQSTINIIPTELRVTRRAEHLKNTLAHLQHTDVKRAAAEVIDGDLLALTKFV